MKHLNQLCWCSCLILALSIAAPSQNVQDAPRAPSPILIEPVETYGDIPWEMEKARLNNLIVFLTQEPNLVGYIVVYAGRRACAGEAQARALRAKKYLIGRGIDASRVLWTDAGHLDRPRVQLETQFRGKAFYLYQRPEPLPQKEVRVMNCRGVISRHGKRSTE